MPFFVDDYEGWTRYLATLGVLGLEPDRLRAYDVDGDADGPYHVTVELWAGAKAPDTSEAARCGIAVDVRYITPEQPE
jgi:hypothetical protein